MNEQRPYDTFDAQTTRPADSDANVVSELLVVLFYAIAFFVAIGSGSLVASIGWHLGAAVYKRLLP